ncbi:MAG: hypothetical protein HYX99_03070 [Chloroflexi bacterium]|nr:hypothetical protein [Chloroflexota bacterium]
MISTVTTTVSTIVSSSATAGLFVSMAVAAVFTLVGALVMRELATSGGLKLRLFSRNLSLVVLPLLFVFAFLVALRLWDSVL